MSVSLAPLSLIPRPLTAAAFAPFGDVIELNDARSFPINGGMVMRHHDLAKVDVNEGGGRPAISLFDAKPYSFPFTVRSLERHPLGSQAFVCLSEARFVVLVAPAGDVIDPSTIQAFVTNGRQGVNYNRGVWHHMLLTVGAPSQFVVIDRGGEGDNCDEQTLKTPILLSLND